MVKLAYNASNPHRLKRYFRKQIMNTKQTKVIQMVTKPSYIMWKTNEYIEGNMAFSVTEIGDTVFVHGSNTDSIEWWQKQFIIQFFIGPRGGINKIKVY
jgi:hypothetical protein